MGVTIEQHRSAIGRFKPSGFQRGSAKARREIVLGEVMTILAVAGIRREAKQVDTKLTLFRNSRILFVFNYRFGKVASFPLPPLHSVCS